jgi:hypothetical protein
MMARWTQDTKAKQQRTRKLWVLPSCAIRCLVLSHVKVRFVSWSWESVGGHIYKLRLITVSFLVGTASLFNIGLADGIPPDQMFASWDPQLAVSIFTLAPVLRSCLRFCGFLIHLLAVVNHRLPHHLLPG